MKFLTFVLMTSIANGVLAANGIMVAKSIAHLQFITQDIAHETV